MIGAGLLCLQAVDVINQRKDMGTHTHLTRAGDARVSLLHL
jgi:hypothetical protein